MEVYKEIEGFDYAIGNLGNVVNMKTDMKLKPYYAKAGYKMICLYKDKKRKRKYIHRLLLETFKPVWNMRDLHVDHINRIRDDNSMENLRWVTRSENNLNVGLKKSNILGEKYISPNGNRFRVRVSRLNINQYFDTLEDAIEYRDSLLNGSYCLLNCLDTVLKF
jgi:hypothetical protein